MEIPEPIKADVEKAGGLKNIGSSIPDDDEISSRTSAYKALSDPIRLKIMLILDVQPLCVCCIKELIDVPDSRLSYHLSLLKGSGLIEGRQEKNWIIYRPTGKGKEVIS